MWLQGLANGKGILCKKFLSSLNSHYSPLLRVSKHHSIWKMCQHTNPYPQATMCLWLEVLTNIISNHFSFISTFTRSLIATETSSVDTRTQLLWFIREKNSLWGRAPSLLPILSRSLCNLNQIISVPLLLQSVSYTERGISLMDQTSW